MIPVLAAIVFSIALPWCQRIWTETYNYGTWRAPLLRAQRAQPCRSRAGGGLCRLRHLVGRAAGQQALVNLGIVGFAVAVGWFYFSDIMDKLGRSLGLIGLGILFLAGGWALERTRRKLVARMKHTGLSAEEAL